MLLSKLIQSIHTDYEEHQQRIIGSPCVTRVECVSNAYFPDSSRINGTAYVNQMEKNHLYFLNSCFRRQFLCHPWSQYPMYIGPGTINLLFGNKFVVWEQWATTLNHETATSGELVSNIYEYVIICAYICSHSRQSHSVGKHISN